MLQWKAGVYYGWSDKCRILVADALHHQARCYASYATHWARDKCWAPPSQEVPGRPQPCHLCSAQGRQRTFDLCQGKCWTRWASYTHREGEVHPPSRRWAGGRGRADDFGPEGALWDRWSVSYAGRSCWIGSRWSYSCWCGLSPCHKEGDGGLPTAACPCQEWLYIWWPWALYVHTACITIDHFYYQVGVAPQNFPATKCSKRIAPPQLWFLDTLLYDTQTIGLIIGVEGLAFDDLSFGMYFLHTWCTREWCNRFSRTPNCRDSRINRMFCNTFPMRDNWIIPLSLGDQVYGVRHQLGYVLLVNMMY